MRVSHALPSNVFRFRIPGLSDFGHFRISIRLHQIHALLIASCGAGNGPLQDAYDLLASACDREGALNETLIRQTIPALVAELAGEYKWFRLSEPLTRPLQPHLLDQISELVRVPIARWTAEISPATTSEPPILAVSLSPAVDLKNLPLWVKDESQNLTVRKSFRRQAVLAYKAYWSTTKYKVTDPDIAREAGWIDRSAIVKFKSCSPKNSLGTDHKIWQVLRSSPKCF